MDCRRSDHKMWWPALIKTWFTRSTSKCPSRRHGCSISGRHPQVTKTDRNKRLINIRVTKHSSESSEMFIYFVWCIYSIQPWQVLAYNHPALKNIMWCLQYLMYECHGVWNHRFRDCLFNSLLRLAKLHITGPLWEESNGQSLCEGNQTGISSQKASNAESVSMSWTKGQ